MTVVTNPARSVSETDIHAQNELSSNESPPEDISIPTVHSFGSISPFTTQGDDTVEPARCADLYSDERGRDVIFVAGLNGDTARYPGHRRILSHTSPVFSVLMADVTTDVIIIDYVDRRAFEQVFRYLYHQAPVLNSALTTRLTLVAAYKFILPDLVERCVRRLDELLDPGLALEILRELRYLCARLPGTASAPPLSAFSDDTTAQLLGLCAHWCDSLAHNVLLLIDEYADAALQHELFEELSYEDLALIVKRETLRVSSETVLVEALSRWATANCKRNKKELTSTNKRAALGELSYTPRYLLLQREELTRALGHELLQSMERTLVWAQSRHWSSPVPVGAEQIATLKRWATPRPTEPAALPVYMSARSVPVVDAVEPSKLCGRRPKRLKAPPTPDPFSHLYPTDKEKKRGCCACFGESLIRAFICLFD